jgi:hypothetical protein
MKKIMTLFIAVALIASLGVGAIAGANEDAFANAVMDEKAQFAYEKAAAEFAQGNDVEGLTAEENAEGNLAKSSLPFIKLMGAVNSAHYVRANVITCCTNPTVPTGYPVVQVPNVTPPQVIVKYQLAKWNPTLGVYEFCQPGN